MTRARKQMGVVFVAMLLAVGLIAPANAQATDHCTDHQSEEKVTVPDAWDFDEDGAYVDTVTVEDQHGDDVDVTVTINGTSVTFGGDFDSVDYCTKASTDTFDNDTPDVHDISYVVVYSVTVDDGDPLTGVRGTFICKAPEAGSFELYVGGETFVSQELDAGDYVFRFYNPNDDGVKFSAGEPAGNDNVVAEWMSLGAGDTTFTTVSAPIAGVSTNTVPADDESADPVNRGTFSTNEDQVCEETPEPEVDIRLTKVWLDADGGWITPSPVVGDWLIELSVGEQVVASLPDDGAHSTGATVDEGVSYDVHENLPGDWEVVACPAVVLSEYETDVQGVGEGFTADDDLVHVVCNQETSTPPGTSTTPDPDPDPDPDPTYDIRFLKEWAGDVNGENEGTTVQTDGIAVEFTVEVDGVQLDGTFAPGDFVTVDPDDDVAITAESFDLGTEECSSTTALDSVDDVQSDGTLTVINTVDCDVDVQDVVVQKPKPKPEDEPQKSPTATRVLAEVEELPRSGASAVLLTLMGLLSVGVGGGMIRTRKRS